MLALNGAAADAAFITLSSSHTYHSMHSRHPESVLNVAVQYCIVWARNAV